MTDFCSYYHLPSSVFECAKHKRLGAVYSYYNVATTMTYTQLMNEALILSKISGEEEWEWTAVLCCAVLCCAVLCCAVLYSALLYITRQRGFHNWFLNRINVFVLLSDISLSSSLLTSHLLTLKFRCWCVQCSCSEWECFRVWRSPIRSRQRVSPLLRVQLEMPANQAFRSRPSLSVGWQR